MLNQQGFLKSIPRRSLLLLRNKPDFETVFYHIQSAYQNNLGNSMSRVLLLTGVVTAVDDDRDTFLF